MTERSELSYRAAVEDFKRARKQAAMQQLVARLRGISDELLAYEHVREQLRAGRTIDRGLQEIPVDAIVGSVGRYQDFTRGFLPKKDSDEDRWARVRAAVLDMVGLPPIEVYQIGEVYFVIDGNHRVSVARQLGAETISAYVTEVETRVPLILDDALDELICKARYADFLEQTNLDLLRPEADLNMTFCAQYRLLLDQIEAHRYLLSEKERQPVDFATAAARWYDEIYLPVVALIREQGILRHFPERSEADLYVLLSERQSELEEALGWQINTELAASELVEQTDRRSRPVISRVGERLRAALVPDELEGGPAPGEWREKQLAGHRDRLFGDYLVPIRGTKTDWQMLDQVIAIARRDNDRLLGLHVVADESRVSSEQALAVKHTFEWRCRQAGLAGELAIEAGDVVDTIIKRAAWADLVAINLTHPPGPRPLSRLGSRVARLIQRCPRPILTIPNGVHSDMDRLLLAYDGSPKADEALFVAAYLTARWPFSLVVLTVETEHTAAATLTQARNYLEQYGVKATYVLRQKPIAEAILETANAYDINLLIMGGFGFRPVLHVVLGSTVDQVLREFRQPVLICR
ncbi:MAG TPA: universal stress protein [Anaerolineae bacterium]